MEYIIYTDGGARGNPGQAGAGIVIERDGEIIRELSVHLGVQTNNFAEYEAAIQGLRELKKILPKEDRKKARIELRTDSELMAKQLNGLYQIKDKPLQLQYMELWNMRVADFQNLAVKHIPREQNSEADRLANEAMDRVN